MQHEREKPSAKKSQDPEEEMVVCSRKRIGTVPISASTIRQPTKTPSPQILPNRGPSLVIVITRSSPCLFKICNVVDDTNTAHSDQTSLSFLLLFLFTIPLTPSEMLSKRMVAAIRYRGLSSTARSVHANSLSSSWFVLNDTHLERRTQTDKHAILTGNAQALLYCAHNSTLLVFCKVRMQRFMTK